MGITLKEGLNELNIQLSPLANWDALGRSLQYNYKEYIANGVGLARYMGARASYIKTIDDAYANLTTLGNLLKQGGLKHPEYLTSFARNIPPQDTGYSSVIEFRRVYGFWPYVSYTEELKVQGEVWAIDHIIYTPEFLDGGFRWGIYGENYQYTRTWKVPMWYRFPHEDAVRVCLGALFSK